MNNKQGLFDYFSVLVIGDDPDKQITKFDMNIDTSEPYILYSYDDINKLRVQRIKFYEGLYSNADSTQDRLIIDRKIKELNLMSDIEYYSELGEFYGFDENNNIVSNENPNGKWITCDRGGKIFSDYIKNRNGVSVTSEIKRNIKWDLLHLNEFEVLKYKRTWELCVDKKEPYTEVDERILSNMSKYKDYFKRFKDQDDYIKQSCSFWCYAVVKDDVWEDMEDKDQGEWISNFYNRYLKDLNENKLITIYECTK